MIKNILLISTFFMAATGYASTAITPNQVPENLHLYNDSAAFVRLIPYGCSQSTYVIPTTHAKFDVIFSLILAAQISGKPIRLRFDGCNANNQGIVVGVYLP